MTTLDLRLVAEEDERPSARRTRRDWTVDSVLFALAILLGAGTLAATIHRGLHGPLVVVDALAGAVACLSLWWRRLRPYELGLATAPLLAVSSSAGPAGLFLLYSVAAYSRWQKAVLVAVVQLATLPILRTIQPHQSLAGDYLISVLCAAVVIAWGMAVRARRQTRHERHARAEAEEQLRVEQIRYAERTRIAREMHDVLAHRISLLSMHAGALEYRRGGTDEEIERAAAVIRASAHQALEDLREMIGLLRETTEGGAPQPPQPTFAALPGLLEESRAAGMRLHADVRIADPATVPDPIGRHALRIVQEALTNARKHAAAAPVDLRIDGAPGRGLEIDVHNPAPVLAVGAPAIPGSGTGLVGLAERATLSGGSLEHGRDADGDFHLRAWLPWPR